MLPAVSNGTAERSRWRSTSSLWLLVSPGKIAPECIAVDRVENVTARRRAGGCATSASSAAVQLSQYGRSGSAAMAVTSWRRNGSRSPPNACSTTAAASPNTRLCHGASKASSPLRRGRSRSGEAQRRAHRRATPIIESRVTSPASSVLGQTLGPRPAARAAPGNGPRPRSPTPGSRRRRAARQPISASSVRGSRTIRAR